PAASRSGLVTRGLAEARAAPGTIIAYATSPGATALDALPGQSNGPYATALAAEIRRAHGARLEDVFIATRNRVLTATRNTQTPWENGSLRRAVILGFALTDTYSQPVPLPAGAFPGLEEVYALLAREVAAQIVSSQDLYRNPKPLVALGDLQNRTVNNALHPQRIAQVLLETLVASGQVSPSANGDYLLNLQLYESAEWRSVGSGIRSYGLSAVILARNGRILSTWSSERRYRDNSPPPAGSLKPQAKTQP
ncbi:MAG: hypothetical protein NW200_08075, partial [Hyphomonadaceae bacterium]|nr:hypothetical protein [Hyphomonadaceae bacterium]